jgi:hypothetical protein
MIKEKLTNHLRGVGQDHILKVARRHEGDIGVDNFPITADEALTAGINKYHLPKMLAEKLASPAVEHTIAYGGNLHPLDPQHNQISEPEPTAPLEAGNSQANETTKIVITEESLRNH